MPTHAGVPQVVKLEKLETLPRSSGEVREAKSRFRSHRSFTMIKYGWQPPAKWIIPTISTYLILQGSNDPAFRSLGSLIRIVYAYLELCDISRRSFTALVQCLISFAFDRRI